MGPRGRYLLFAVVLLGLALSFVEEVESKVALQGRGMKPHVMAKARGRKMAKSKARGRSYRARDDSSGEDEGDDEYGSESEERGSSGPIYDGSGVQGQCSGTYNLETTGPVTIDGGSEAHCNYTIIVS